MTQRSPHLVERYGAPSRSRRSLLVAVVAALVVAGGGWLTWVVVFHSRPDVSSQLVAYDIRGEHTAAATWTVVRRSADVAASCRLRALSDDHSVVGERTVAVTSGPIRARLTTPVRTERRAGSVQLVGCSTKDRPAPQ